MIKKLLFIACKDKRSINLTVPPAPIITQDELRKKQEDKLYQLLKKGGKQILLHGESGTGKTHMARKLFYRLGNDCKRLAWVEYGTDMKSALLNSFEILEDESNSNVKFSRIIDLLTEEPEKTILFVDDVKKGAEDDVLSRITGLGITILITSRCDNIQPYKPYQISPIEEEKCVELFYSYYLHDKKRKYENNVRELCKWLHYHTMSIIMLARVVGSDKNLLAYYWDIKLKKIIFSEDVIEMLNEHIGNLLELAKLSKDEIRILQYFALMPSGETPLKIMKWFDCRYENIETLVNKGWIVQNSENSTYILHDLFRDYIQQKSIPTVVFEKIFKVISENDDLLETCSTEEKQYILDTAKYVVDIAGENDYLYHSEICCWLGDRLFKEKQYEEALMYYKKSLQIQKSNQKCDYWQLYYIYYSIGTILCDIHKYHEALDYYGSAEVYFANVKKTDVIYEEVRLLYLAGIKNNMANIYGSIDEYTKSLEYHKQALHIKEKLLGCNHLDTAMSYNNIASVYCDIGNYKKALQYQEKALNVYESNSKEHKEDIAGCYNNIATIYNTMGNYSESLEYHQKALVIYKHNNEDNVNMADCYNNIANVYCNMGDYPKSLEYHQKALKIFEHVFGFNHLNTAKSFNNVGIVYEELGYYEKALNCYEKALKIYERVRGSNHTDTAMCYNNIGNAYNSMGNYIKSISYHEKAKNVYEQVFGNDHRYSAGSFINIGYDYFNKEEFQLAMELYQKALKILCRRLGKNHPETAGCYNNIGEAWRCLKQYKKSLICHEKALEIQKSIFHNKVNIAESYYNLGVLYYEMGDFMKALEFTEKALLLQKDNLPNDHPYIANTFYQLYIINVAMGNKTNASHYIKDSYKIYLKKLGEKHPRTIKSKKMLQEIDAKI